MSKKLIIPWDLGATKCAVALVEYDDVTEQFNCLQHHAIKLKECSSLRELIERFEIALNIKMSTADAICIGAAGVYDGEQLLLTAGYPYMMNFAAMAKEFAWHNFTIIHDYAPILCATFTSYIQEASNIKYLNKTPINLYGRRVALGIGTGLGVKDGVLLSNGDFWLGTNEMGHIGISIPPLATVDDLQRHNEFIHFLMTEKIIKSGEALTFEKILSGQGVVRLHQFFSGEEIADPELIGDLIRGGQAAETNALFAWYLGLFIGTVQLSFMPDGGIWITGGVALKHLALFDHADFNNGITASPAYLAQREKFSLAVMCDPRHAFFGGAYYAVKRLLMKNSQQNFTGVTVHG